MKTIQEVRKEFPQYADLSDEELGKALHGKYYADMPYPEFASKVGLAPKDRPVSAYLQDFAFGVRQPIDAGAQMLTRGLESLMPAGSAAENWMRGQRQNVERLNQEAYDAYRNSTGADGSTGASISRGLGQGVIPAMMSPFAKVASTMTGAAAQGGVLGGLTGAFEPVYGMKEGEDFWKRKGESAAQSAMLGGGVSAGIGAAAKAVKPHLNKYVELLMKEGITPTPGQIAGGAFHRLEDALGSVPLLGDIIKSAQGRTIGDFNRAVYARVLEPLGDAAKKKAKMMPVGQEGVRKVGDILSQSYDDVLSRSVPSPIDPQFGNAVTQIVSMVPKTKEQDYLKIVNRVIDSKITPAGTITPSVMKEAESELGRLVRSYRGSGDAEQRELSRALRATQFELREMFARNNPKTATELQKINEGWANLVQLERAASYLGAKEGVFSPSMFKSAVKAGDSSVRKRGFARGDVLNKDLVNAAEQVLPQTVPDSGTPLRVAIGSLISGAGLHAIGGPGTAAVGGAAALPYTKFGQKAFAHLAATRPDEAERLRQALFAAAPYGAIPVAGAFGE